RTSALANALSEPPLSRPLYAWTLRGSFQSLYGFLTQLDDLPWRVVVLRLDVELPPATAGEPGDPPLAVHMTVAL
ncbi:MAG: hypothetical protein KDD82_30110, partial [Planctomycetes bacterium]|nr:hypothetical protein [Planctomycetota bacterium]